MSNLKQIIAGIIVIVPYRQNHLEEELENPWQTPIRLPS